MNTNDQMNEATPNRKISSVVRTTTGLRWRIALLVAVAIAISYLDRQTLPWAFNAIQSDIPISNQTKAFLDDVSPDLRRYVCQASIKLTSWTRGDALRSAARLTLATLLRAVGAEELVPRPLEMIGFWLRISCAASQRL
jgi:hypothetical protein